MIKKSPNIVCRTKYQLSKKNPDGKYNSKKIKNIDKYTNEMLDYYSNIDKKAINLIDYYTGKINKHDEINLVTENGKYANKEELEKRKKYISQQINNSNLWQMIISFQNDYIDKNISLKDLEQLMVKEVLPQFFKKMGFQDINKMQYQIALHSNTDNYHFHIAFLEKAPNTLNSSNQLTYRRKGKISKKCINFVKMQTELAIEREHEFKPKVIDINKNIDEIKQYFKYDSYNNILKNQNDVLFEEKILLLGKLLDERVNSENNKIKYNSIYDQDIKQLTNEIKKDLFNSNAELKLTEKDFKNRIDEMNDYFRNLAIKNNISMKDIDTKYTNSKEKYIDNYILNSIVNYARYNYMKKNSKINVNVNDVIQEIVLSNYRKNKKSTKLDLINNSYRSNSKVMKSNIRSAIRKVNSEMEEAANEFHKLFQSDSYEK